MTPWSTGLRLRAVVAAIALLLLVSWPGRSGELPTSFRIGVGDILKVSVWKSDELSVTTQVRPDGRISVPLIGDVVVDGLTPSELEAILTEGFAEFVTAPSVFVVVEKINSMKVFVSGNVEDPGAYDIVRPTRLLQALTLAGWVTEFAKTEGIVVLRETGDGEQQRFRVGLKAITSGKTPADNLLLVPGDTIIVP